MKRIGSLLLFIIIIGACQKNSEPEYPNIFTGLVTEINSTGATFMCRITELGINDCHEFGFVWDTEENPSFGHSEKYIFPFPPEMGDFSKRITTTLENSTTYSVRAFIRQDDLIVYGKETRFISHGSGNPEIESFFPTTGNLNDTITIVGKDFSYVPDNNRVLFDVHEARILSVSQDTLMVIVPEMLGKHQSTVSVSVKNRQAFASEKFTLINPEILDFYPKAAPFGTTLTISGNNFNSDVSKLSVLVGNQEAIIIYASENEIRVQVPNELDSLVSTLLVEMNNLKDYCPSPFSLILPEVYSASPSSVNFGTSVRLSGNLLDTNPEYIKIFAAVYEAEITELRSDEIVFVIPDELDSRTFRCLLDINGLQIECPTELQLRDLTLTEFYPTTISTGQTVSILGEGFSPVIQNNRVMIGNVEGIVTGADINLLEVLVPLQDENIYEQRELVLHVEVIDQNESFAEPIRINDPWFRLDDAPLVHTFQCINIQVGSNVYLGLRDTSAFWVYEIETQSWRELAAFPGTARRDATAFHLDGRIYFGTGQAARMPLFSDMWIYHIAEDSWTQTEDFPGEARFGVTSYTIANKAYMVGGTTSMSDIPFSSCWEYDPLLDTWERTSMLNYVGYVHAGAVVIGDMAYYGLGFSHFASGNYDQLMYTFDPALSEGYWAFIPLFPEERTYRPVCFSLNGFPYFAAGRNFYYFDNAWLPVQSGIQSNITGGVGFSYNGKGYAGLGYDKAIWEYDPLQ